MSTSVLVVSNVLLWILVVLLGVSVLALYRYIGGTIAASGDGRLNQGPSKGSKIGSFRLPRDDGRTEQFGGSGKPTIYFFAGLGCGTCQAVLPELEEASSELGASWSTVVVLDGHNQTEVPVSSNSNLTVFVDRDKQSFRALGIVSTPFVLFADERGRVGAKGSPRRKADFLQLAASVSQTT